jgi:hypothetical protein
LLGAVSVVWLAACGPEVTGADGSLTEILDLSFDRADLEVSADSVALRLIKYRGAQEDTALKIGVLMQGAKLIPGVGLNLAEAMQPQGQRGVVSRNVYEDDHHEFPALHRGRIVLEDDPAKALTLRGEFSVTFEQGYQFGAGRTVHALFQAGVVKK